jgi:quercetin dioxygenase-like cupin family protein
MNRPLLIASFLCAANVAAQRPPVKCVENSPERRGDEGCTILASSQLAKPTLAPVYWHIDRFDSLEEAQRAAGADGVAAEAHGRFWLMTVEQNVDGHHGGKHVAAIGPLALPAGSRYSMRVQSSLLRPEATTPVHIHSGPEVFYIVSGEQCLETIDVGHRLPAEDSFVLPAGAVHRGRVTGPRVRRALSLVLHDPSHRTSYDWDNSPPLTACR